LDAVALTIVLASGMTALDLCASALWFWVCPEATRYADLDELRRNAKAAGVTVPAPLNLWLFDTRTDVRYGYLREFRHSQIHRMIRQDVVVSDVGVGAAPPAIVTVGSDPGHPATRGRGGLLRRVAEFVPERGRRSGRCSRDPRRRPVPTVAAGLWDVGLWSL
jgi:hypothetical protein